MNVNDTIRDNDYDTDADMTIAKCLAAEPPRSFFLFAGAGSGKTRSLKVALEGLEKAKGERLRLDGKHVGVITYTNKACNEIKRRVNYNILFHISTIHSFAWSLMQGLTNDIRAWLKDNLEEEIADLNEKLSKSKPMTKTYINNQEKLLRKQKRLAKLPSVRRFVYNPDGDNFGLDSLNHAEVIKIISSFLNDTMLMKDILVNKYPIILIDESQDTHKELMDALLRVQSMYNDRFAIGVIGDMMQRIYPHGKDKLDEQLPDDWEKPVKRMNHRSCSKIIDLINKVRAAVDQQQQLPRSDKSAGFVRLFIRSADTPDKPEVEAKIYNKMAQITQDEKWRGDQRNVKTLILEHRMAAKRLGFLEMWTTLDGIDRLKTGLRDGSLPFLGFFSRIILPLVQAHRNGDRFAVMDIVRRHSSLLDKKKLERLDTAQFSQVEKTKDATESFLSLWNDVEYPTFFQVLEQVQETELFPLPDVLAPYVISGRSTQDETSEDEINEMALWQQFLNSNFAQIEVYNNYINGNALFDTHHGVKGQQFARVCVIMDDSDSNWRQFQYDSLFGLKESKSIEATRRLFYVICSRAQESLALVAYTSNPAEVKRFALRANWFVEEEIEM